MACREALFSLPSSHTETDGDVVSESDPVVPLSEASIAILDNAFVPEVAGKEIDTALHATQTLRTHVNHQISDALRLLSANLTQSLPTANMDRFDNVHEFASRLASLLETAPCVSDVNAISTTLGAAIGRNTGYKLFAVLASPTAVREFPAFLEVAKVFRQIADTVSFHPLIVRWDNLNALGDSATSKHQFQEVTNKVAALTRCEFPETDSTTIALEYDQTTLKIIEPRSATDIMAAIDSLGTDSESRHSDGELLRDALWCAKFYAGQRSLASLGPRQAMVDLAIRRTVGKVVSGLALSSAYEAGRAIVLTSELHPKLLQCYRLSIPSLNISVRSTKGPRLITK